jgi:hypothetical protein
MALRAIGSDPSCHDNRELGPEGNKVAALRAIGSEPSCHDNRELSPEGKRWQRYAPRNYWVASNPEFHLQAIR